MPERTATRWRQFVKRTPRPRAHSGAAADRRVRAGRRGARARRRMRRRAGQAVRAAAGHRARQGAARGPPARVALDGCSRLRSWRIGGQVRRASPLRHPRRPNRPHQFRSGPSPSILSTNTSTGLMPRSRALPRRDARRTRPATEPLRTAGSLAVDSVIGIAKSSTFARRSGDKPAVATVSSGAARRRHGAPAEPAAPAPISRRCEPRRAAAPVRVAPAPELPRVAGRRVRGAPRGRTGRSRRRRRPRPARRHRRRSPRPP